MAKYIDADRLRKEVKRLERAAHKSALGCADSEIRKFHEGKDFAYQHVGILIDSLQQEQTDCHTVEDWIQHIKNADQLTKDVFSKGPYDVLYDALNHPYQHCYDAIKEFGELCFQVGVNSVKQEQPEEPAPYDEAYLNEKIAKATKSWEGVDVDKFMDEVRGREPEVDLKKEIKEWVDLMVGASFTEQGGDFISEVDYRSVIRQTALHFYELGLNARKEENK